MANAARSEPGANGDQLTQAVTVGLCLALAAVLLVLALVRDSPCRTAAGRSLSGLFDTAHRLFSRGR